MIRSIALWAVSLAAVLLGLILREEHLAAQGKIPTGRLRRLWFGVERRRSPRYRVNWSVKYRCLESKPPSNGHLQDISQTGAGLTLFEKVLPGSRLDLEVPVPGWKDPLRVTAVVIWSKEVTAPDQVQRSFFTGVHFQGLSASLQEELVCLLKGPGIAPAPDWPGPQPANRGRQSALYAALKRRLWLVDLALTLVLFYVLIFSGAAQRWSTWVQTHISHWPIQVAVYAGFLWALALLPGFPLDWIRGFRIEHWFGLSTQRFEDWLKDYAKQLGLSAVFGLLIVETLSLLLRRFPTTWWAWAAAAWVISSVLLARVFPTLLIPLFYRQKPLKDGLLRERLETLLARCGTRVHGIFEVNLSRTTQKANACLCGMGKSRRVLVSDTLLSHYPPEEIEVVLAHELGHHRLHHIGILIAVSAAAMGFSCLAVDRWAQGWMPRLGIPVLADLSALPLIGLGLFLAGLVLMPITQGLSRRLERKADQFALEQTLNSAAFIATMRRLGQQNLAEENPPRWAEWLLYDHPPISKRIAMAEQWRMSG